MPAPSNSLPIALLGGGITGLTAAHALIKKGHAVRLFELSSRLGGAIRTERTGEWLVEAGPNSLQAGTPEVDALIAELGLTDAALTASPAAKHRYIVRGGRPLAAPLSPPAFLRSPLFGLGAKYRVLTEFLTAPKVRTTDLSLAAFIQAHFGRDLVDYGLQPFVSGVYAGNVEKLSARHAFPKLWQAEQKHGSLLKAQLEASRARRSTAKAAAVPSASSAASPAPRQPTILSFSQGLQMLPDALAAGLPAGSIELDATVQTLLPGAPWRIIWTRAGQTQTEEFSCVLLALPAPALARVSVGTLGERPLAALDLIEHPPLASLFFGFRREDVGHALDGFGMLVPALEKRDVLGVIFSSSLFPGRVPAGHVGLTVMLGGAIRPELTRLEPDELIRRALADLRSLLGVRGEPVFVRHQVWPRAIPQYNLGHERFLEVMTRCEYAHPGLLIGGQARDGISLPNCIQAGLALAHKAAKRV